MFYVLFSACQARVYAFGSRTLVIRCIAIAHRWHGCWSTCDLLSTRESRGRTVSASSCVLVSRSFESCGQDSILDPPECRVNVE